jgi:membrane protein YqaA with SNARE-associated domain
VAFPGLADLFFLPLALARPSGAYRLALLATAGTVTGSVILYAFGRELLALVSGDALRWAGVSMARFEAARAVLAEHGGWVILASTMSPLSTKWMSIASGGAGVPWPEFVGMLTLGRLTRTMGLAWLVRNGGAAAVERWVRRGG